MHRIHIDIIIYICIIHSTIYTVRGSRMTCYITRYTYLMSNNSHRIADLIWYTLLNTDCQTHYTSLKIIIIEIFSSWFIYAATRRAYIRFYLTLFLIYIILDVSIVRDTNGGKKKRVHPIYPYKRYTHTFIRWRFIHT